MHFLVLYGTTEGHTRKVAQFVGDRIHDRGHESTLADATDPAVLDLKLRDFDGVVVASSIHIGRFQSAVEEYLRARHQTLNGMHTAFLSVSLSAASTDPDDVKGREHCVHALLTNTQWKPGETHHVAGAFKYTQYDFFKRWGMKLIAYQKGVSTDTSKDLELTDWPALAGAVDAFVSKVAKARS